MIHNPWVELRLKSTLGILMWFVVSTVIAYHIGIVDMLGTQTFPSRWEKEKVAVMFILPSTNIHVM